MTSISAKIRLTATLIVATISLFSVLPSNAQTKLANIFTDHMVLQRGTTVNIWGTDEAGQSIQLSASWEEESATVSDENGEWNLKLNTPKAGGPFTITVTGSETIQLEDILIGEVWFCSGQSNMEMPIKGYINQPVFGSNEAKLNAGNDQIRLFHVPHKASVEPMTDIDGEWLVGSPDTIGDFSATAYFFAKKLQQALNVPIGLVHASWGGSSAEAWTDAATLRRLHPELEIPTEVPEERVNQAPSLLHNAMLHPLIGYTINGAIWYQGESNIGRYEDYGALVTGMVNSWRQKWGQGQFPFYYVQIAPYRYSPDSPVALQREAQLATLDLLENSGMAVTLDIGNCTNIHPGDKETVGNRLAYIALAKTYGMEGVAYSGPVYDAMEITDDGKINLSFRLAECGLSSFGKPLSGFKIAGEDKVFKTAKAQINRNRTLSVWSEEVPDPVAVRYAFENCPEATLYNTSHLPASSFRTDDW
ncbi:MAG: sialate O-acetylesterase [Balneolaceae bacterium]|nr:sialate O-acetylesterase [Balneolaceae bacterium]